MKLEEVFRSPTFTHKEEQFFDTGELVMLPHKFAGGMAYYQYYGLDRKCKTREDAAERALKRKVEFEREHPTAR